MKKLLLYSALLLLSAGTAWADVEINETNFPDANFRSYLLSQSYGSDGVITDAEIANVKNLAPMMKNIQSLQGIEFFTALSVLQCGNNQLTSLDVSKNTALTSLDCSSNQLTSLDVTGCAALTKLQFYQNQIKGTAMDAFIATLPTVSEVQMRVLYNRDEQNVMTTTQVAAAKAKGWIPYIYKGSDDWVEYEGIDPSTAITGVEADQTDTAPWFTLSGAQLDKAPAAPGIYIHGGRKVVVK